MVLQPSEHVGLAVATAPCLRPPLGKDPVVGWRLVVEWAEDSGRRSRLWSAVLDRVRFAPWSLARRAELVPVVGEDFRVGSVPGSEPQWRHFAVGTPLDAVVLDALDRYAPGVRDGDSARAELRLRVWTVPERALVRVTAVAQRHSDLDSGSYRREPGQRTRLRAPAEGAIEVVPLLSG